MPIIEDIRHLDREGISGRDIAEKLGVSRDSVAKYTKMEDFSPKPPTAPRRNKRRVMTKEVCGFIAKVLDADRDMPRKQRHTAKRIYDRLVEEHGFSGSYRSVSGEVAKWREEWRLAVVGTGGPCWWYCGSAWLVLGGLGLWSAEIGGGMVLP